jgi:predicted nucleic acid-binding protein
MFLDTSGMFCCYDAGENHHAVAVGLYRKAHKRLTHNYVLAEFIALAETRRLPRQGFLASAAEILTDPKIEVVWVDQLLHNEAMDLLRSQLDKTYSLCDAVSFVLMHERNMLDALTTDRHFEQAGFRALLRL